MEWKGNDWKDGDTEVVMIFVWRGYTDYDLP